MRTLITILFASTVLVVSSANAAKILKCNTTGTDDGVMGMAFVAASYQFNLSCTDAKGRLFDANLDSAGIGAGTMFASSKDPGFFKLVIFCPTVSNRRFNSRGGTFGAMTVEAGALVGGTIGVAANLHGGSCFIVGGGLTHIGAIVDVGILKIKPKIESLE